MKEAEEVEEEEEEEKVEEVEVEEERVEEEEEEEIRMRRHSPRLTLPMQWKEEKRRGGGGEAQRRVSPRLQGVRDKVLKEAEEAKMYLFGLA